MCLYVGASFYTRLLTLCLPIMLYIGRVILGLIKPIYSVIDTPGTGGFRQGGGIVKRGCGRKVKGDRDKGNVGNKN